MPAHRYVVTDLLTDRVVGRPALSGVSYTRRISTASPFSGVMAVTSQTAELARLMSQRPLGIYAIRGSTYWWGGILWQPVPGRDSRGGSTVELAAAGFESYPAYRRIWADIDYADTDRAAALRDLWTRMQASTGGNIGVGTGSEVAGGDLYTGSWAATSGSLYSEAGQQLATMDPAFEWTVDVYGDPTSGRRRRRLRIGTPLLGDQTARHWLTRPSTLQGWRLPVDHGTRPTHALARGASVARNIGSDTVPITSDVAVDADAIAQGRLRVDGQADYDQIADETQLPAKALDLLPTGPEEPTVTVTIPADSTWNPGNLGDTARVRIDDPFFDGGQYSVVRRIIGVTVTPETRTEPEKITLEYQPDSDKGALG